MSEVKFIARDPHKRYHDCPPRCKRCNSYLDGTAKWRKFATEEKAIDSLPGRKRLLCYFCSLERRKRTGGP